MFYKEIAPDSWDSLRDQGIGHIVPFSSRGLTASDGQSFFRKTAASEKFIYEMREVKLADGEVPIHINAIGASEVYGANRKGDAFSEQTCRDWHHTFVTDGKLYEHHINSDPKRNFGKVAAACYNDKMRRIEMLVIANGDEKTAEKNAGHAVSDKFLEKLEKNAEVAVSMGCLIRHDTCSHCGNKARTRLEYCDEDTCLDPKTGEYGFGCKNGLAKVASDGRMQYVDNIEPHFFDISLVGTPADRSAYGFVADYLKRGETKTAAWEKCAEDYLGIPKDKSVGQSYRQRISQTLFKLAEYEKAVSAADHPDRDMAYGFYGVPSDQSLGEKIASFPAAHRTYGLRRLAEQGILLSPESFATAMGLDKAAGLEIRQASQNIYQDTYKKYADFSFDVPASILQRLETAPFSKIAEVYLPLHILSACCLDQSRVIGAVPRGVLAAAKTAGVLLSPPSRDIAEAYALYKSAALCCFPESLQDFGSRAAVLQTAVIFRFED